MEATNVCPCGHLRPSSCRGSTSASPRRPGGVYRAAGSELAVRPGEFCAVVGPTGCGKSTTLALISGLEPPSAGEVRVMGQPVKGIDRASATSFRPTRSSPGRTCSSNVAAGPLFRGVAEGRGPRAGPRLDRPRRPGGLRGPLPAPALRRHAQARGAGAELDQRAADPADGRALQRPRRADARA